MKPRLPSHVPFVAQRSMTAAWVGEEIYVYGGVGKSRSESILDVSSDLWAFDPVRGAWRDIPHAQPWPSPRRCPGVVVDAHQILSWGGSGLTGTSGDGTKHTFDNDFWSFDTIQQTWRPLPQRAADSPLGIPAPRYFPVMEKAPTGLVLFGGYGEDAGVQHYFSDTWILQEEGWSDLTATKNQGSSEDVEPSRRYGAASAIVDGSILMFGGFGGTRDLGDVWRFDPVHFSWTRLWAGVEEDGPAPRYSPAIAAFEGYLVIFGGRSRLSPKLNYSDLWTFDIERCRWQSITGHAEHSNYRLADVPAYHAKTAYCTGDSGLWILGGEGSEGHVSDFWRLDLPTMNWELIQSARPDDPIFW